MDDLRLTPEDTKAVVTRGIRSKLLELGSATKAELSSALQISFPTISKFLLQMEGDGEIASVGLDQSSGGRRARRYAYNPNYMLGLAIFLEKGETSYTVFNCSGEVIEEGSAPSVLEEEVSSLVTYIEHIRHAHPKIHSVAIGVPGAVNNGRIFFIPSYEKYRDVDLKGVLEEQLSIPVVVENDMNAAALGYLENRKMKDSHSLIYLYLGQNGPGAGIVVNGEIVRGKTFFSGEVAFIPQYEDKSFYQALAYECKKEAAVSRSEQRIDAVARLVASMTAILNPHSFIFCADEVDPSMLHRIAERSAAYVPQEHLPELAAGDWRKDYLYGLRGLGLSLLLSHTRT